LRFPHQSSVKGSADTALRELRPRGGRSVQRPIYRRVGIDVFVIFAVGPEAMVDSRGFNAAVRRALKRLRDFEAN
jgi:hypothetical protein